MPLKLLKIVLGSALVFREHPVFDEIDRGEVSIFLSIRRQYITGASAPRKTEVATGC
jgi:hypothetical protein